MDPSLSIGSEEDAILHRFPLYHSVSSLFSLYMGSERGILVSGIKLNTKATTEDANSSRLILMVPQGGDLGPSLFSPDDT